MVLQRGTDPCVYDLVEVSPSTLDCSHISTNGTFYVIHPVGDPETLLCYGRVFVEDKTPPSFITCPAPRYFFLAPNTERILTPADLGVSAVDHCTPSPLLTTEADPFVISSNDAGSPLTVNVIASDNAKNSATCTVTVIVSVDNCSTGGKTP